MTENQLKHMVDRFLSWSLPENFAPDAGISFKPTFNDHLPTPMKHNPTGTNLLNATQAEAMVRHMVADLPSGQEIHLKLVVDSSAVEATIALIRREVDRAVRDVRRLRAPIR